MEREIVLLYAALDVTNFVVLAQQGGGVGNEPLNSISADGTEGF